MLPHKEQPFFYPEEVFLQSASKATKMFKGGYLESDEDDGFYWILSPPCNVFIMFTVLPCYRIHWKLVQ